MDGEYTAFSKGAFNRDVAAVSLGDVFDDGKAQTGTAQIAAAGFIHPVKSFKQPGQVFFGDSDTPVLDNDFYSRVVQVGFQMNGAVWFAVFDGIV